MAPNEEVAKLTYFGLYALQHRGQESAGIAVSKGTQIMVHKEMVWSRRFSTRTPSTHSPGAHLAVGHCRYSTTGASVWMNAQPTFRSDSYRRDRAGLQWQPHQHLELREWLWPA